MSTKSLQVSRMRALMVSMKAFKVSSKQMGVAIVV